MFIIILCKSTHTVPEPGSHVSQPVGLRLRCRYGNKSTSMLSDNIFNSVWLLPLLFQQQQRLCQDLFYSDPTVDPAAEMLMKGAMETDKKNVRGKWWHIQRAPKGGANRWIFKVKHYCLSKPQDEGEQIRTERERGRDGQWQRDRKQQQWQRKKKGNVKERNVVIPLSWMKSHSSVNFSPSNPIRSTAHPAMAYGTAEQGGIKRGETNTRRKVGTVWKRAMKNV